MKKVIVLLGIIFLGLWIYVLKSSVESVSDLNVSKSNLILPSILFVVSAVLIFFNSLKDFRYLKLILIAIVLIDLLRFGWKFTPFTNKNYLYPNTKSISFLESKPGEFRIMTTDPRIFSPNFSVIYKIQSVEGYDPLYLKRYAELVAAMERKNPNINPPFGFNRIITPHNFDSEIVDLMNVKYVLSLTNLNSPKLTKVYQEGETRIYQNSSVLPRVFFVAKTIEGKSENDSINKLFQIKNDFRNSAIAEGINSKSYVQGEAQIVKYEENEILIETKNTGKGFLVLTDSFYPAWKARIDGKETKIYMTDFNFRGIEVPEGGHNVEFYINLL